METLHVLVVDDEAGMRSGVERALRGFQLHVSDTDSDVNFTVSAAESGEEALALIEAAPPDILLLDHKLPGLSGMEVLEKVIKLNSAPLVIMITAYASIETAVKATRQGAYDFLPKPFTPAELKYSVQKAAGRVVLANRARALAEEKKRVRFEFIRVLGHELKAPLGAVESYMDLFQKRTLGGEVEAYEKIIGRTQLRLEQMRKLIVDLLDMTKIESGQRSREFVDLNLVEVAERAIEAVRGQAAERGITVDLQAAPQVMMKGDINEVEMILNNLVTNAVKYNRDQGRVDVSLKARDGEVEIAVADTGIGMTEQEAAKLFGEFVRIKNEKTRQILGSGLGLSIVKRLAELNGGGVTVESRAGEGSTFRVRLLSA